MRWRESIEERDFEVCAFVARREVVRERWRVRRWVRVERMAVVWVWAVCGW